jgi:hypothetical protein
MNIDAIIGCCIVTAFHQRGHSPDDTVSDVEHDMANIIEQAQANLNWCGLVTSPGITEAEVKQAVWGIND